MQTKEIVFALVTFLHNLFTAAWIGGLLTLVISVLPASLKLLGKEQTQRVMNTIQQRLSVVVYVSIVGLTLTGLLMSSRAPGFTTLFGFGSSYATVLSLKHIATIAIIAGAVMRSVVLKRTTLTQPEKEQWSRGLLLANLGLGLLILLLSGFLGALGAASIPPQ